MSIIANFPGIKPSLNLDFTNTKRLDPRITFDRASTATYYGGKTVAKAEENLLVYSQDFDNAEWFKQASTVISNSITAPDGTVTADTLAGDGSNNSHLVRLTSGSASSSGYTVSVFAKSNTNNYLQIAFAGDPDVFANYNLSSGSVGATNGAVTASIQSVGNGWYRCIMGTTSTTATYPYFALALTESDTRLVTNTLTTSVYIWGAQLEQRAQATAYTLTTSQPITNYIPVLQTAAAGVARFDHNPVTGESLGLLIEEQRTNLLTYSEGFSNAVWFKEGATVSANTVVAPDGTLTGDKIVESSTKAYHAVYTIVTVSSTNYTYSAYAKKGERNLLNIRIGGVINKYAIIDLTTGAKIEGSLDVVTSPVGNGWFRVSTAILASSGIFATNLAPVASDYTVNAQGQTVYQGDGYSGIYIWGAQLEQGVFPTSYIKTEVSQVTRAADSASMTGVNFSSWYRQDEGTLFTEALSFGLNSDAQSYPAAITAGGDVYDYFAINSNNLLESIRLVVSGYSTSSAAFYFAGSKTSYNKSALSAKTNDFAGAVNGSTAQTDVSGTMPKPDRMAIGSRTTTLGRGNIRIKKIAYYPKRLSNTELQALTA